MRKETSTTKAVNSSKRLSTTERPTNSKIGPFAFDISYLEEVVDEQGDAYCAADEVTLGHCFGYTGKIEIKSDMSDTMEKDTLLHEHLHAIWFAAGIRSLATLEEESAVGLLTPWLLMFIRDNPDLIGYLQS